MVLNLVACGINFVNNESSLREVGSTLPDYSSREGVFGGSAGLVSGGRSGVRAHVDRYFLSGIRLLGPSILAASMSTVIGDYTFWGFKQKRKRRTCIYYGEICDALTNHQICAIVVI